MIDDIPKPYETLTRPKTLTSLAQTRVEQLIFNGDLLPGEKVKEAVIATQIGFSRGPVREACWALVGEGFLVSIPQRGVFVREFTAEEVADLYEIRGHLGLLVGKLAAESVSRDFLADLEDMLERMRFGIQVGEENSYFRLTLRFNDLFLSATSNGELTKIYRRITRSIRLYRMKYLHAAAQTSARKDWLNAAFEASIDRRTQFLAALKKTDGELAGALLRRHAEDSRFRTEELVLRVTEQQDIAENGQ